MERINTLTQEQQNEIKHWNAAGVVYYDFNEPTILIHAFNETWISAGHTILDMYDDLGFKYKLKYVSPKTEISKDYDARKKALENKFGIHIITVDVKLFNHIKYDPSYQEENDPQKLTGYNRIGRLIAGLLQKEIYRDNPDNTCVLISGNSPWRAPQREAFEKDGTIIPKASSVDIAREMVNSLIDIDMVPDEKDHPETNNQTYPNIFRLMPLIPTDVNTGAYGGYYGCGFVENGLKATNPYPLPDIFKFYGFEKGTQDLKDNAVSHKEQYDLVREHEKNVGYGYFDGLVNENGEIQRLYLDDILESI